jgi:16S rRNA (guanine527-N7)-methyltransferase
MNRVQHTEFSAALEAAIESFGLDRLHTEQAFKLERHYEMLCRWNKRINLTRIVEPEDMARHHYAESMFGALFIREQRVLDIGSGAGFPAIPIAVARPDVRITALEANNRKSLFLTEAREALQLTNFSVVRARLEDFDWSGYELLTSRALERAEVVFSELLSSLNARQRLMLYCTGDLVSQVRERAGGTFHIDAHRVPHSEARLVATFSRAPV